MPPRLPFRIRPGAPTSSLDIAATGNVGVGTGSPLAPLHVWRQNSAEAQVLIQDTSGTPAVRRLLDLQNNGGIRMRLSDNSTGTTWAYQNIGTDFRINANAGAEEFVLTTAGNLTILGALSQNSDRNVKTGVAAVDPEDVLARLAQVPVSTWSYKADRDPVRHMGPMAQDFAAAFGLGADERRLAPADMGGVALAAIQALHRRLERRDAEVAALQAQNADLAARLAALETALRAGIGATAAGQ